MPANKENSQAGLAFVRKLEANGGTNVGRALATSQTMLSKKSDRTAYLIVVSDGLPTVGELTSKNLVETIRTDGNVRVFDFGVGYDVNTRLLDLLAERHHGTSQYVEPDESLEIALSNFYSKIKSPVLTDVTISYNGVTTKNVYPAHVKDLFAGGQTLVLGRY